MFALRFGEGGEICFVINLNAIAPADSMTSATAPDFEFDCLRVSEQVEIALTKSGIMLGACEVDEADGLGHFLHLNY